MLKKITQFSALLILGLSISLYSAPQADASYGRQFGKQIDYSYRCNSESVFKFNGNGKDRYGRKSRCYDSRRHYKQSGSDKRYIYDQYGYRLVFDRYGHAYGIDQKGRDTEGVCRESRCRDYHYRDYGYYHGQRYDRHDRYDRKRYYGPYHSNKRKFCPNRRYKYCERFRR